MVKAIKKKRTMVLIPEQLTQSGYIGKIFGYYHADTNYFNIIEYGKTSKYSCIGEISNTKKEASKNKIVGVYSENELTFFDSQGKKCQKQNYSLTLDVFSRNTGILETSYLLDKMAVISGCGSVGSLVAVELAKAGVGNFLLIDNDILEYHNLSRHQCGIDDVGKYKVSAVKEKILAINPMANVIDQKSTIERVPVDLFDEFFNKYKAIIVGCADNREGDIYADKISDYHDIPFVSIGFWERAFAGEIFYKIPNEDMVNYQKLCENIGEISGRATQNHRFYTDQEDLRKVKFEPGISVDINFITIIAIKLILDIINYKNANYTQKLINNLTQYTLVCNTNNPKIGGEFAEIFSYPLQVTTSIKIN